MVKNSRGFAYILLLVFLVTLSILALEVQPMISMDINREKEKQFFSIMKDYATAFKKFHSYYGRYPGSLSDLVQAPPAPRFIRKLVPDPFRELKESTPGWDLVKISGVTGGIVSVRSKSEKLSICGIPYKDYYYNESGILTGPGKK